MDALEQQPAEDTGALNPDPAALVGQLLENTVRSMGGSAGMIAVLASGGASPTHLGSSGLSQQDAAETASRLTDDLPFLLAPRDAATPARMRSGRGWEVSNDGLEAHISTAIGPLHLVVFPLHSAANAVLLGGNGDPGPLSGLLLLFHPDDKFSLREQHPAILDLLSGQLDLVLVNAQLLRDVVREARWLEAVLQHTGEGLVILDAQGRVLGCNAAFRRLTGWSNAELHGRDLGEALDITKMHWLNGGDEEPWRSAEAIAQATADGEDGSRLTELVLTTRSGSQIYTEARVSPIPQEGDGPGGAVVSFRDVTAEREAEELQATFLSVISHELQTPLAVIKGYAELLSESGAQMKPAKLRDKLSIIAEESSRLSGMVSNLLDASRIQAGGLELNPEPVDIRRLVRRVVQKMEPLTDKHQFILGISADLPPVLADHDRIEQVLTNLVENAIKYSPSGGRITITADETSEDVIVRVSDEGIGVPEAEKKRIFSRFARLDSRMVRQMKGVGLGLYIARAIVLAHGGRIWVDSAPGGGAQFSFSLPRQHKAPLPVLFRR